MEAERNNAAKIFVCLFFQVLWTAAVTSVCFAQSAEQMTEQDESLFRVEFDQQLNQKLPLEAEFTNSEGETKPLSSYFGKRPVILSLVYFECPSLCTEVLNALVASLKQLKFEPGKDFDILTVSFDPSDTSELAKRKKAAYIQLLGKEAASSSWHFLTGEKGAIDKLTDAVGFHYVYDERTEQFAHASGIIVLTSEGVTSRYFLGLDYDPKDLKLALVEAGKGEVGSFTDQIVLLCYHYDPLTGKYGVAVMNVLRFFGVLTILAIALFIIFAFRREKHIQRQNGKGLQ